jgi:DNA-binding MarR family transcriptional regulator
MTTPQPDEPDGPAAAAVQVLAIVPRLGRRFEAATAARGALTLGQLTALEALAGGLRSIGELARVLGITPQVAAGLIDRLERRDYARRGAVHGPDRRRRIELAATGAGRAAVAATIAVVPRWPPGSRRCRRRSGRRSTAPSPSSRAWPPSCRSDRHGEPTDRAERRLRLPLRATTAAVRARARGVR